MNTCAVGGYGSDEACRRSYYTFCSEYVRRWDNIIKRNPKVRRKWVDLEKLVGDDNNDI